MGKASRAKWRQKLMADNGRSIPQQVKVDPKLLDKLIKKAEEHVETFEYELAKKCYEDALSENPNHVEALEAYAGVLLELGEIEDAEKALLKAIKIAPKEGYGKYFSLAQMTSGEESLHFYHKGIKIIQELLKDDSETSDIGAATNSDLTCKKLDLSNAFCAVAEVYMTDCCDEVDAEEKCKLFIQEAIDSCPTNPDAFRCLSSFQLIKGDFDEGKESMEKSLNLWLPKYRESRENKESTEDILDCPLSYDLRLTTCKLVIELEMYNEATDILDGLLDENDEVVDVWYLLGWLNFLRGPDYFGNARYYLTRMKEISKKLGDEDQEQLDHVNELLIEIGPEDEEDGETLTDSDEWETEDEMEQ